MKGSKRWLPVVLAIGVGLIGCEAQEGEEMGVEAEQEEMVEEDTVSPEEELQELEREYERAYAERDAPALQALHTKEYMEITPEGEVTTELQFDTTQMAEGLAIETESMTVAESGDVAYGSGTTTLEGAGPEGEPFTAEARWLAGFKKVDGEWKIDRLMTTTPTEAEMMPEAGEEPGMEESGMEEPAEQDTTAR